ncbi:hypothetical protein LXL04_015880 [Taraxacum kok-saghyz]
MLDSGTCNNTDTHTQCNGCKWCEVILSKHINKQSLQGKPTSIRSSKLRRGSSSGIPGGTPFGLHHYTNVYVGQASFINSLGYPRDAPATVLYGEWFRFRKPSDQYPHHVALTTYFRLMVSSPKTRQKDLFMEPKQLNPEQAPKLSTVVTERVRKRCDCALKTVADRYAYDEY